MAAGGALIGALRVTLGIDSAQFEAGTKRARAVAQRDVSAIQKTLTGVATGAKALFAGIAAVGLVDAAKRSLDYAASLGEVAQQLGVTTRDLQVYRFAATQVGISQDEMDKALQRLTRTMGQAADGQKKQVQVFKELGPAVEGAVSAGRTAGDVIPLIADALAKIENPAKRARIETELFGKSGQQLDTLLSEGGDAIRDMADEADKLGLIMGDALIAKADAAADRLSVLGKVLEIEVATAVAENADGILIFANAFIALVSGIGDAITWLRKFGYEARQAVNAGMGWTPFGGPASGGRAQQARLDYFKNSLQQDEDERNRRNTTTTVKRAQIRDTGALTANSTPKKVGKPSKDRSEQRAEAFQRELAALQDEQLQLQAEASNSIEERNQIEQQRIRNAQNVFDQEIARKLKGEDLTAAQAEQLRTLYAQNSSLEQGLQWNKMGEEAERERFALKEASLDATEEQLRLDQSSARTAADRRRIGLAMLDLDIERQRAVVENLQKLYALNEATESEVRIAEDKLSAMQAQYSQRADGIRRDTMGPMETYLNDLPRTADELREKFEGIKVDALNNSLDLAAQNVIKLKGFAGDLFNQLISDVIRLNLQSALTGGGGGLLGSIGTFLGLAGGGPSVARTNSIFDTVAKNLPKYASGGSFRVGGLPGIDRNVLALNGIPVARVSHNENVSVGYGNDNGGSSRVEVVPSPYFNVVVDGRAAGVAGGLYKNGAQASYRRGRQRLA